MPQKKPSGPARKEEYFTIRETAEYIRCSPNTIGMWLTQKRFPRIKAGRRTLIARSDIESFLRRKKE